MSENNFLVLVFFNDGLQISYRESGPDETLKFLRSTSLVYFLQCRPAHLIRIHKADTGELFKEYDISPLTRHLDSHRKPHRKEKDQKSCSHRMFEQEFQALIDEPCLQHSSCSSSPVTQLEYSHFAC